MILSDEGIRQALKRRQISIDPEPKLDQYTSSAVDLVLGNEFKIWDHSKLKTPGTEVRLDLVEQVFLKTAQAYLVDAERDADGSVILCPYSVKPIHLLATTRERIHLRHGSLLAARVEGRSSLARIGLMVHLTAPTIHAGFEGNITLEMINHGPFYLKLVPNKPRVCQLIFERLESESETGIQTQFLHQTAPSGESSS